MKKCSYCGRDNTDEALHCDECGTEFACEVVDSESDNKLHDEVKRTTIRTFTSHDAANIARSNLEAHGIKCWVDSDDCAGWYTNLTAPGGVRLSVRASDAETAIALLSAEASVAEINQIEIEATASAPAGNPPMEKLVMGQIGFGILSGIVVGILLCLLYQWANTIGTKTHYSYTRDGKVYEAFVYENGHMVETVKDRNLDGKWDAWIYYNNGHVIRAEYDNNFDGMPDEWVTYSNSSPVTAEKDRDFNGIPDEFVTYKNGMIQQTEIKPNGSTFATQRWIYQNGVQSEIWRGGDSNGNFSSITHYDSFFNPISKVADQSQFQLLTPSK
jgi:antitoxin component YwqK of YwqJK toxin-antitoxin module